MEEMEKKMANHTSNKRANPLKGKKKFLVLSRHIGKTSVYLLKIEHIVYYL